MGLRAENIAESGLKKKEQPRETLEKTRALCAEYHEKMDRTTYFDSKAIDAASKLLPSFKAINQELLSPAVKLVVRHRLAYLTFMASFQRNPAIGAFLDTAKDQIKEMGSPEAVYALIQNNDKFKALSPLELHLISSSLLVGIRTLAQVNNNTANWGTQAESSLKATASQKGDPRIDDETAAQYLQIGLSKMLKFVDYTKAQKFNKR